MIHAQTGMAPADREAAISSARAAIAKTSVDLGNAVAAADARAVKDPEYERLVAEAAAAKVRANVNQGTREQQQAAATAADDVQQSCDRARRALVLGDSGVVATNKVLTVQNIRLWSLSTIDIFDGLQKPADFTKQGTWTFKGDTLVAANLHDASAIAAITFPAQLPTQYLLRLDLGPCDMNSLEIMVPVGNGMTTVQYDRLSFAQPHTLAIFVSAAQPHVVLNNAAPINGFLNELNKEVHQPNVASNSKARVLPDQAPTIFGQAPLHTCGIVVWVGLGPKFGAGTNPGDRREDRRSVPFYSILAIPCKDIDEANEILAEPVYLGADWQLKDYKLIGPSEPIPKADTNANGSHPVIPYQEPVPGDPPQTPIPSR